MKRLSRRWRWWIILGLAPAALLGGAPLAWVELLTSGTPAELAPFYEKTLGWTSKREGEGARGAVVFSRGGQPVAGVSYRAGERHGEWRSRWTGFFAVADPDAAEQAVIDAGGRVIAAGHAGAAGIFGARQTLAVDAEGALLGLITAGADGRGGEKLPGFWPVLLSRSPAEAAGFYRRVFGGEVREEARTPLFGGDFLLTDAEHPWAGVQPNGVGGRAGWLVLIAVADIDAATTAARRGGGRVLRAPGVDLIGGRVAVLADPVGGVFGLCEALPLTAVAPRSGGAAKKAPAAGAGDYEVEALAR